MEWEIVVEARNGSDTVQRLAVPGGWIYRNVIYEEKVIDQWTTTVTLCFVPSRPLVRGGERGGERGRSGRAVPTG